MTGDSAERLKALKKIGWAWETQADALPALAEAARLAPEDPEIPLCRAWFFWSRRFTPKFDQREFDQKMVQVRDELGKALELGLAGYSTWPFSVVVSCRKMELFELADAMIHRVLSEDCQGRACRHFQKASFLYNVRHDRDGAINELERALAIEPHWESHSLRGCLFVHKGDHQAALRDFNAAVRAAPTQARPLMNRGRLKRERGDPAAAAADFEAAFNLEQPDSADVCIELAEGLLEGDRPEAAVKACDRAMSFSPQPNCLAAWRRALAKERLGDIEGAIRDLHVAGNAPGLWVEASERLRALRKEPPSIQCDAPEIAKIIAAVLMDGVKSNAAKVLIKPIDGPSVKAPSIEIAYEVDGLLRAGPFKIHWAFRRALMSKLKIMCETMNILTRRSPQVGLFQSRIGDKSFALRVEIMPSGVFEETCIIQMIERKPIPLGPRDLGLELGAEPAAMTKPRREFDELALTLQKAASERELLSLWPGEPLSQDMTSRWIGGGVKDSFRISIELQGERRQVKVRFFPAFSIEARRRFVRGLPRWQPAFTVAPDDLFVAACRYGDEEAIKEAFSCGVDKDAANRALKAVAEEFVEASPGLILRLLEAGADRSAALLDFLGPTGGRLDIAALLIDAGADVNARSRNGGTPLMSAARYGGLDMMKLLIAKGADINAVSNEVSGGTFALREATIRSAVGKACPIIEAVKLLVEAGANVNLADSEGWTPLMRVVSDDDCETMEYLIGKGADTAAKNRSGETAADIARRRPKMFNRFQLTESAARKLATPNQDESHVKDRPLR